MDLGADAHCGAVVGDTSRVFISVGLGFHLECELPEAPSVIARQLASLGAAVEGRTAEAARLRGNIRLATEAIAELSALR